MTHPDLDKLEAALRIVTNAMAEKYPLGTDFGRYESEIITIIDGAQKWEEHLAAQRQGGDAEWFIDGTLVYSLKHGGWKKGAEIKTNATTISVDGDNAESIAGIIHAALNNHPPAVTGDRGALEALERAIKLWKNSKDAKAAFERNHGYTGGLASRGEIYAEEKMKAARLVFESHFLYSLPEMLETIRAALLSAQAVEPGDLVAAMTHVIAIAKAYKADESAGRNYKGANESNRKAIERAEMLLYPYLNTNDGRV